MPWFRSLIIPRCAVDRDSVIPKGRRPRSPLKANLNVDICFVHTIQIIQDQIALGLVQPNNRFGHCSVDEQRFPASGGVCSNDRVDSLDVLRACLGIVAVEICMSAGVDGLSPVDDLTELGAQLAVGSISRGPQSVTPDRGDGIVVQVRNSCWLFFMDQIRVPPRCASWLSKRSLFLSCLKSWPNDCHAWDARNMGNLWLEGVSACIILQTQFILTWTSTSP